MCSAAFAIWPAGSIPMDKPRADVMITYYMINESAKKLSSLEPKTVKEKLLV